MEERIPRRASVAVLSSRRGWYSLLRGRIHVWIIFFLVTACPAAAQEAGRVVSLQGAVEVLRAGQWQPVKLEEALMPGEVVRTRAGSRVAVQLADESQLKVNANSQLELKQVAPPVRKVGMEVLQTLLRLLSGEVWVRSYVEPFEIETKAATATIRGTELNLATEPAEATRLTVVEGVVEFRNPQGSVLVAAKEQAIAKPGEAPRKVVIINPRDAVQWALYYPPLIDYRKATYPEGPDAQTIRRALKAYRRGALPETLRTLEQVPPERRDARFFTLRAGLLLSVSQVAEARADIEEALRRDPSEATAHALRSIIALVQNQKKEALRLARQAVEFEPQSSVPQVALSYAYQATFDLEKALKSLEQAAKLAPEDALIQARLAELELSRGELERALKAARRAVALDPELARTQTVLGFAYLAQIRIAQAKAAFERAITLDSADPLPRLGLGLARIRESDLHEGRREIEVATGLDPNNSIVRSYLGKAYFEEKRTALTDPQYATAKELDPKDPTPFFYDAIQKQTTNRPVEALRDLQKAIELNDNRAVYRSRLLLDSDLAARSASLGRIYTDLGFQQLALVEGWKSVNTDPTNFSAHRFLADSYSVLPRHEVARVSELLQSQLLQPLNMTPIQPRLAESSLFLISAGGPGGLSFNEFNPIFNQDGVTFQTSGLVGENSTYAGEGVISGIYKKTSFSVGGLHFTTDGFRINSDQTDDIVNAFVQHELTPQTSIQAEYRYRDSERGDLLLRFFEDDFFPGRKFTEERHSIRLGTRHAFSPGSILLGSFMYHDADFRATDDQLPDPSVTFFDIKRPESAYSGELQHLFRSRYVNLTSGIGYFDINGRMDTTIGFDIPPPEGPGPFESFEPLSTDLQHINVYEYAYLHLLKNVTFTVGLSADFLSGDSPDVGDKDQFNPKFGITWEPIPGTTLHAAAFRALKRTLITDQTLEPTQVAGFNQLFDDINGTESWRYGVAIDQKFTTDLFGGAEFSKRDLKVPFSDTDDLGNTIVREEDIDDYLGRAYLFWTPHRWLALRAEYIFGRFKTEGTPAIGLPKKLDTHRVPLGISFFHPSGLSASLGTTYVNQDGKEFILQSLERQSGRDDFWLVDVAINYRLPKRYGFITIGATNLFDQDFKFFDLDADNPSTQPDRMFLARVTLALP
jgi:tetratricopeptide (TPR) repeat protein